MESENNLSLALKSVFTGGAAITYSKKNSFLLFILPIVYGSLAWLFYCQSINFFTTYTDSTYIYLINGIDIASGNFKLGHYDNPGTTAHWLAGIVFFFTHLFWGKGDIMEDAINRPEFYLRADTVACIALVMLSTYVAGRMIAKNTGNYITAFFFQLIAISSYLNVHYMVRVCPEYIMIMTMPFYCAYLWILSYKKSELPGFVLSTKSVLFLAFATAALFVAKITCLPFILVPLFFIENRKQILVYIVSTLVFALLIMYPIWYKFDAMFKWFFGLATHSGIYGSGKEQMVDKAEYIKSLKTLFTEETFFVTNLILLSVLIVAGLFQKKWKNSFYKMALAFWVVIILQVLLVAKHYSPHYLIATEALAMPAVLAGLVTFPQLKLNKFVAMAVLVVSAGFLLYKFNISAHDYQSGNNQYKSSIAAKKQFGKMPKIFTTGYEESCFVESALSFGAAYGGDGFQYGREYLRKRYPTSFLYESEPNKLYLFFKEVAPSEIFENYPAIMINFLRKDEAYKKHALDGITAEYKYAVRNIRLARSNPATGDEFYVIEIDTVLARPHYTGTTIMNFDFEKTSADKSNFVTADGLYTYGGVAASSKEQYTSASTSVKLTPQTSYVGGATFAVKQGDGVEITANRFSEDGTGGIVLGMVNDKSFERVSEEVIADLGKGWKKIRLKARFTKNFTNDQATMCFFYFGKKTCYFDDLSIKVLKK